MERPVVLNALLCFVQSYREHPQLENLIHTYFSRSSQRAAHALLEELSAEPCAAEGLLPLFDKIREQVVPPPVFAASDLNLLPLTLVDADSSYHILREIWQLKSFIHDALNGSIEDSSPVTKLRLVSSMKASPERDEDVSQVVAASSPESPTNGSVASFGKNQTSRSETPLSCTQAPTRRRLNDAVRKLTDRLAAQGDTPLENESLRNDILDSAETTNAVEADSPDNNRLMLADGNNDESTNALWSPQDPMAYLNMLRNLTSCSNASIFPLASAADISDSSKSDGADLDVKMEDMMDDCDKISNDSSPSPSDLSFSRDSMDYGNSMLKIPDTYEENSEKPFTCGHANCHKRFANKFLLKKHQFIHTGLRPHICPFCSKRFNRKDNLLRHKKTHLANAMVSSDNRRRHTMLFGVDAPTANEMAQLISITGDGSEDI
uniref:C2H2-type domain-containing protein n=1 Tax=Steinernema glaseri TaxID=37863 RepID=A0A1I7Z378_9BILA